MQVELLRELVQELRPLKERLAALQNPDGDTPMLYVGNSATDMRRQYIERMTRNHMEHQGLQLTARGDVIDGDFEGKGKDTEEVQRLEQIVEKLEKNGVQ